MKIGQLLAACRKRANLTQLAVARALGVSSRFIQAVENGRRPLPEYHIVNLPLAIRAEIAGAAIAEHEAAIGRLTGSPDAA